MPNPTIERVYWDACVFLSYLEKAFDRAPIITVLLERAQQGKLEIVTSTISLTEVAYVKEEKASGLSSDADDSIRRLWVPPSPITLVDYHWGIAEVARGLIRGATGAGIKGLKPMDAIHLATAMQMKAKEFHTYDDLARFSAVTGLKIAKPYVSQVELFAPGDVHTHTITVDEAPA